MKAEKCSFLKIDFIHFFFPCVHVESYARIFMFQYGRGLRLLSFTSKSRAFWDPTVSLELSHPTLILLEKCSTREHLKQILGQVYRNNLIGQTFSMSRLIVFSAISHPENLDMAMILFNHYTPNPNLYIYNTMISALSFSKNQSFALYNSMLHGCTDPDHNTLLYLLQASKCSTEAKQIHCHATVTGLISYGYLQNSLIKMYLQNGDLKLAVHLLMQMPAPDSVSFNTIIVGYAKKGLGSEAMEIFQKMVDSGLELDGYTMLGLLLSCGQLRNAQLGKSVHAWLERRKSVYSSNLILGNALLDMYLKCAEFELAKRTFNALVEKDIVSWNTIVAGCVKMGEMELARAFFSQMPNRDLVSWNSLIAGYSQKGNYAMVVNLINSMVARNVMPDSVTMVNLISATAENGVLDQGKSVHGRVIRMHMKMDVFMHSALIDMYCKCGSIERALVVFRALCEKDIIVWTTMITGYAFHGYGSKALELFAEMQKEVMPNKVTFLAILTACNHSGLVDQGLKTFNDMKVIYGIEPGVEHYGCLVDLLGRSGRLEEAKHVIDEMPMKPSRSIWGAMLSACRAHGNVEIAEKASMELQELEPGEEGSHILLSNVYAASGRWGYSDKVRENMGSRGVKKTAGCSSVVVNGVIRDFIASDKQIPKEEEIQSIMSCLKSEMEVSSLFPSDILLSFLDSC